MNLHLSRNTGARATVFRHSSWKIAKSQFPRIEESFCGQGVSSCSFSLICDAGRIPSAPRTRTPACTCSRSYVLRTVAACSRSGILRVWIKYATRRSKETVWRGAYDPMYTSKPTGPTSLPCAKSLHRTPSPRDRHRGVQGLNYVAAADFSLFFTHARALSYAINYKTINATTGKAHVISGPETYRGSVWSRLFQRRTVSLILESINFSGMRIQRGVMYSFFSADLRN